MGIVIDVDDSAPVFAQLMGQIKKAVLADEICPGDALPSVRQLANDLSLNNKTVARAYRALEREWCSCQRPGQDDGAPDGRDGARTQHPRRAGLAPQLHQ